MKAAALSLLLAVAASGATSAPAQHARPVVVGADPQLDACPSTGQVTGLDGQHVLSVRAAPTPSAREVARARPGQILWICDTNAAPGWYGVVYDDHRGHDCGLRGIHHARAYAGPCPSGWVQIRYVAVVAG